MDVSRKHLLADPGFAGDQHGDVCISNVLRNLLNLQNLWIRRENVARIIRIKPALKRLDLFLELLFFDNVLDGKFEFLFFEGLDQEIRGAQLHGVDDCFDLPGSGEDDDGNRRIDLLDAL